MKDRIRKLFSYCLVKWWVLPLISSIMIGLLYIFDHIWLLALSLFFMSVSIIYQLIKKKWILGCLSLITMVVLFVVWFLFELFPSPEKIHHRYSKQYEDKNKIQNIIGVKIPKFKVVESHLTHMRGFDFEFEVRSIIKFKKEPQASFFIKLDSICSIPVPEEFKKTSKFFYYGLESKKRCWNRKGESYMYTRNTDFGNKLLHSTDAYFYFTIKKDSREATIEYGNY